MENDTQQLGIEVLGKEAEISIPEVETLANGIRMVILEDNKDQTQKQVIVKVQGQSQIIGVQVVEPFFQNAEHPEHLTLILETNN